MLRSLILILTLLLIAAPARSQTGSDSQTLQALLVEVRQLRHDLRITTVAAQRAQILIYRVQAQESIVRRMQERVDDTRSKLEQIRSEQKKLAAAFKEIEDSLNNADNAATTRKEAEQTMARIKDELEIQASNEQEAQTKLTESEHQLRVEQAKLGGLQDQLDRLETQLEGSTRQTGSNPH
jgi:chromosome segregation ATPase